MVATLEDPIARAWELAWTPPDRRSTREWAEAEVVLEGDYSMTGRFAVRESKQFIKPLECLDNDAIRMVNILKAPRTGGSLVADIWIQRIFHNAPAPFMMTQQTDDDAERHYLTKTEKTFKATRANAALFSELKKKRDLYQFPHMNLYVQGANMNSLQSKGVKYEWNDEVWIWKPGMLNQAFSRTGDFKRVCKILNISQGGNLRSEWDTVYNQGKRHNYGVRCIACGVLQPYEFFATMLDKAGAEIHENGKPVRAGVVWDRTSRTADGRWDIARAAETTRWRCRHCGADHADEWRTYERFAAAADYICLDPTRRDTDTSLRWNAMVAGDWWTLTKKFLQAIEVRDFGGNTGPLEDFYKKENASFWDPSLAQQKITVVTSDYHMDPVLAKEYKREPLEWEEKCFIVADYQDGTGNDTRHLLVTVRAWSDAARNRSRMIWYGRLNTFSDLYKLQRATGIPASCVCVDGSFQMMEVAAQCAKYGWTMLIGDDPEFFLHKRKKGPPRRRPFSPLFKTDPLKGKTGAGRSFCWTMRWSNPSIKNLLWNLRHGRTRHQWELPVDVPPEYRDGIDSEIKKFTVKKHSAVPVMDWVKIKPYNHPWDDECMQTVLAVVTGCLTFDVEEDAPPPKENAAEPQSAPPMRSAEPEPPHHQPDQLELLPTD